MFSVALGNNRFGKPLQPSASAPVFFGVKARLQISLRTDTRKTTDKDQERHNKNPSSKAFIYRTTHVISFAKAT